MKLSNKIRTVITKLLFPDIYRCLDKINKLNQDVEQLYKYDFDDFVISSQLQNLECSLDRELDYKMDEYSEEILSELKIYKKKTHELTLAITEIANHIGIEEQINKILNKDCNL